MEQMDADSWLELTDQVALKQRRESLNSVFLFHLKDIHCCHPVRTTEHVLGVLHDVEIGWFYAMKRSVYLLNKKSSPQLHPL